MKKLVVLTLLMGTWTGGALADWQKMSGPQIDAALTNRTLQYERAWQRFYGSGRTLYNAGRDSWGYWRIENDQYCSMWPPQELWACYDMERAGERLRFVGASGEKTEAAYKDD